MPVRRKKVSRKARPAARATRGGAVDVGRLGAETVTVNITKRSTVSEVVREAGFRLGGERIMLNGRLAGPNSPVKPGDLVLVITAKEAGRE